jgi:hypothetical protein
MARIKALAAAAPKDGPKRAAVSSVAPIGVDRLTADDIRNACGVWIQTRELPKHVDENRAAYARAMADTLNDRSAYLIRRQWHRVVRHVLFVATRWPTERDLMEAAKELAKLEGV